MSNNEEHANQPGLCEACQQDVLDNMPEQEGRITRYAYCSHCMTHAAISINDGQIVFWTISGPATAEQAAQLAGRMQGDEFKNVATHPSIN